MFSILLFWAVLIVAPLCIMIVMYCSPADLAADSPQTASTHSATEMVVDIASSGPSGVTEDIYQYCPPGLDALLDTSQVVVHMNSLRHDQGMNI